MQIKILLIAEFSYGSLGLSYSNAFKRLGCEVVQFDLLEEYKKVNPFAGNKYLNKIFGSLFYKDINQKLIKIVKLIKPELIFIIKGYFMYPQTLLSIKEDSKALIFNFNPDNPFNTNKAASSELIRKSIPLYDCYFIWGNFLIPRLEQSGVRRVEYLPFAYDVELHYPVTVGEEERKYYESEVVFIGSWDKEREEWLKHLLNYDLAIWGNGWDDWRIDSSLRKRWRSKVVLGEELSKVCNASKIVLNLLRKQNGDAHNMRTFEVPACEGFMLTTRTKEQCDFFEENKDIVCFESPDELISKINQFLPEEQLRKDFSLSAYKKVKRHTYIERAKHIIEVCEKLKSKL